MIKKLKPSKSLNFFLKKKITYNQNKIYSNRKKKLFITYLTAKFGYNYLSTGILTLNYINKFYFSLCDLEYSYIIYMFNTLNTNFFFKKLKFDFLYFYKHWSIFNFYYIPRCLIFNKSFLNSFYLNEKIKQLFWNFYFYFNSNNLALSPLISNFTKLKINFKQKKLKINFIFNSINSTDANFTLIKLITSNIATLLNKKNSYLSYWSFINTSLYLTWSFLNSSNISSSGLDIRILKNFNTLFFRIGNINSYPTFYEWSIWDFWNFFLSKGIPYTSIEKKSNWNDFLLLPGFIFWDKRTCNALSHLKINRYNYWFLNELLLNIN